MVQSMWYDSVMFKLHTTPHEHAQMPTGTSNFNSRMAGWSQLLSRKQCTHVLCQVHLCVPAVQVESTLEDIGQLPGLTMDILRDTSIGKAVSSLNKLARLHPGITACDHIASKARSVLTTRVTALACILKEA